MIMRLGHLLRARDDDAGIGLIEILVASLLGLLLMTSVGAAFISTSKLTNLAVQNRNSSGAASNAMQELIEVIHLATPIAVPVTVANPTGTTPAVVSATPKKLVIYSLVDVTNPVNPAPSLVTLDITTGSLVDSRCVGTPSSGFWTFTTCSSTSTRTVAGTFIDPTAAQNSLFTYLDGNGVTLAISGGSLPGTSIASVASIIISVNLLAPRSNTRPAYLQSKTGMPNVGLQQETS